MATLDGNDLGTITSEEHTKLSNLEEFAMPYEDSDKVQAWDFDGVKRIIRLNGKYTAITITDIRTFISNIEGIIDGSQDNPVIFASDTTGTNFNVKIKRFKWVTNEGQPLLLNYELELIEAEY